MKKNFYILIIIAGFNFTGYAQSKLSSLSEPSVKSIKYYPNPAYSVINFEFDKNYDKSFSLEVYNFIGKKVFTLKTVTPKINIPLTDFFRGVYIFQFRDRSGKIIESGKFQVIK